MRSYQPRQRLDGNWDYACGNSPIGYCSAAMTLEDFANINWEPSQTELDRIEKNKHKHHTCGHATKEEAIDCYFEYILDNKLSFHESPNQQQKCRICKEWTTRYIVLDECQLIVLCNKHLDLESIKSVAHKPEISWRS